MAGVLLSNSETGRLNWSLNRDSEGHREYKIVFRVKSLLTDGPSVILNTPGLPLTGSFWNFGGLDIGALCYPDAKISTEREKNIRSGADGIAYAYWTVEKKFSTKPLNRCQDTTIEDPLLEPQKISGSFIKFTKEATKDNSGAPINSSSHELIHGPLVEVDAGRPTVIIEQNRSTLELELFSGMVDDVNDRTLWGLGARKIKLSNVTWERLFFGVCDIYYKRTFEFEINFGTFDLKDIIDEGTKFLRGHWDASAPPLWVLDDVPDKTNPSHFQQAKDPNEENIHALLDGNGEPAITTPATLTAREYYEESNFLLLNIPTTF